MSRITFNKGLFFKLSAVWVNIAFLFGAVVPSPVFAQWTSVQLSTSGTMVPLSAAFTPPMIKGLTIHPNEPFQFDFIVDTGDSRLEGDALKTESTRLIKYFLAALTVPEDQLWVNLSPYEKDRIVPEIFGQTEMSRDLLAQDYLLKQLTASLMYPEEELGEEFWKRVYAKAQARYGNTEIPLNTFNKVWIVPEKAVVYVHGESAFVMESHLKVMLEEDYVALSQYKNSATSQSEANGISSEKHYALGVKKDDLNVVSGVSSEVIREILIPEIEQEVNEGKTFANLRQIYNAVILATWYKKNLKNSVLSHLYVDQGKTKGVDNIDPAEKERIYEQYVAAFKKGAFDYIKEDYDPVTQTVVSRKYFSGGMAIERTGKILQQEGSLGENNVKVTKGDLAMTGDRPTVNVAVRLSPESTIPEALEALAGKLQVSNEIYSAYRREGMPVHVSLLKAIAQSNGINPDMVPRNLPEKVVSFQSLSKINETFQFKTFVIKLIEAGKPWRLPNEEAIQMLPSGFYFLIFHEFGHLLFLSHPEIWQDFARFLLPYVEKDIASLSRWFSPSQEEAVRNGKTTSIEYLRSAVNNMDEFLENTSKDEAVLLIIHLSDIFSFTLNKALGDDLLQPKDKPALIDEAVKFIKERDFLLQESNIPRESSNEAGFKKDYFTNTPGGIDLNPANMNLQTSGDAAGFSPPVNLDPAQWQNIRMDGLVPIILNITPVSFPQLLGVQATDPDINVSAL